jgi:hypothetical protein
MNDTPGSSIEELQHQIRSLRTFLLATLAVLVLLSFALNVFIFRQVSIASKQLEESQKFVGDYNKVSVPMINEFLTKLTVVSKTNAEIGRLLAKYNIQSAFAKPGASTMQANPSLTPMAAPTTEPNK